MEKKTMKKILIVDDHEEIRKLVEITLRVEDYQILQAKNGEEAIEIVKAETPDLIIMDVVMPGKIDGVEATRILKKDPETKACTILILTSKSDEEDIEKGMDAGANDYFTKPFSPLELIRKVEEVLG
jgi:two-component system, OmpR family, phosphate regulon response regulator PhoB